MWFIPRLFILAVVCVCVSCKTLPLPSYIKPCNKTDPNLNECAARSAQAAIPYLVKGDRKYKVPVLDPLDIALLSIAQSNGSISIDLNGYNMKLSGFKDVTIKSLIFDIDKKTITVAMFTPHMEMWGNYTINGKIIFLPITGQGSCHFKMENVDLNFVVTYNLVQKADGLEYVVPYENKMNFKMADAHINMDNLFGNKALSDSMNVFMNANWELMAEELGPQVALGLGRVLQNILKDAVGNTPYKEIFL